MRAERRRKVSFARKIIYEKGNGVGSKPVEALLKPQSLVPTVVSFSDCYHEWLV